MLLNHWLFVVALAVVSYAADAAETYRNPVIDENLADPAVIHHDGTYYLYATGEVDGDNGYRVYTSADLMNWKRGPVVFRPGQRHVWAPDVWRDPASGRFYRLYSGSGADTPDYAVGYATSRNPIGPFTRAENNPILHRDNGLFGPGHGCAIRDGGGRWWFVYHQKRTARREWDRFICIDPLRFDEHGGLHGRATRGEMLPGPALWKD